MPYHHDLQPLQGNSDEQKGKIQKGTRDEHTPELQWGSSASANKKKENFTEILANSLIVLQVQQNSAQGASSGGTGCETRQAQDQESMARAEPKVDNGPPPRSLTGPSNSTKYGVAAGELQLQILMLRF